MPENQFVKIDGSWPFLSSSCLFWLVCVGWCYNGSLWSRVCPRPRSLYRGI